MPFRANLAYILFKVTLKSGHDNAETVKVVAIAKAPLEVEQTGLRTSVVMATTVEERNARIREARVIAVPATVRARTTW